MVRPAAEGWEMAAIEPQKESSGSRTTAKKKPAKVVLALPKGLVDPGEKPEQTAVREVVEETGLTILPFEQGQKTVPGLKAGGDVFLSQPLTVQDAFFFDGP